MRSFQGILFHLDWGLSPPLPYVEIFGSPFPILQYLNIYIILLTLYCRCFADARILSSRVCPRFLLSSLLWISVLLVFSSYLLLSLDGHPLHIYGFLLLWIMLPGSQNSRIVQLLVNIGGHFLRQCYHFLARSNFGLIFLKDQFLAL